MNNELKQQIKDDVAFLKELQEELRTQDNDFQAATRFWTIMDYKTVLGNEDYDSGHFEYFYNDNDGDYIEFHSTDLKEFIKEYYEDEINEDKELRELLNDDNESFSRLWEYVENNLNGEGYFGKVFVREEEFIVSDTMFLTKEEAERHLELNRHHYTEKAHTYAMTAWRAPKVERLFNILETFDWEKQQEYIEQLEQSLEALEKVKSELCWGDAENAIDRVIDKIIDPTLAEIKGETMQECDWCSEPEEYWRNEYLKLKEKHDRLLTTMRQAILDS